MDSRDIMARRPPLLILEGQGDGLFQGPLISTFGISPDRRWYLDPWGLHPPSLGHAVQTALVNGYKLVSVVSVPSGWWRPERQTVYLQRDEPSIESGDT